MNSLVTPMSTRQVEIEPRRPNVLAEQRPSAESRLIGAREALARSLGVPAEDITISARMVLGGAIVEEITAEVSGATTASLVRLVQVRAKSRNVTMSVVGGRVRAAADGITVETAPDGIATVVFTLDETRAESVHAHRVA